MNRRRPPTRAAQHGMTLLEVLLALVVSAAIITPLTAWAMLAFGEQVRTTSRLDDTNESNLLLTYFTRDVHSAAGITTDVDCVGGEGDSASGVTAKVLFSIAADENATARVVYTVAPSADDETRVSIWRRTCATDPAPGDVPSATELVKDLDPAAAVEATCAATPTDSKCGQVTLSYPARSGATVRHSAARRSGTRWPS